jgi:hypothetical protein
MTYIDVFVEGLLDICADNGQDRPLGSTFWDIFVLQVLSSRQAVVLVEESSDVGVVVPVNVSSEIAGG